MSVIGFGDPERTVVMDWVELAPPGYSEVTSGITSEMT